MIKTKIVELKAGQKEIDADLIQEAADILLRGGLVVFPTETVYGLGGNATDPMAAEKIYAAKGRPADNPLIIHIADPSDAERYTVTSTLYYRLAKAFMPGPLTVVMPVRETIPKTVTAGLPTVAVRCPLHHTARALIRAAGVPIAAPSANLSGSPSPTCCAHVIDDMQGRVDMILDGGESEIGLESTIVKIEDDNSVTLLRPGAITPKDLEKVCDKVYIAPAVLNALKPGEIVLSPGMKYKHYAPKVPFFLLSGAPEKCVSYLADQTGNYAVLCYEEDIPLYSAMLSCQLIAVGKKSEPDILAHRLFYTLREADKQGFSALYAPLPRPEGLGLALYNRMIRAAAHHIITL